MVIVSGSAQTLWFFVGEFDFPVVGQIFFAVKANAQTGREKLMFSPAQFRP
jgi:hypothetical protein